MRADDGQDLAYPGLTFERRLRLVEEADVLDRDRRWVGEGLDKADLLVAEWRHLHPSHADHADDLTVLEDGNAKHRVHAVLAIRRPFVFRISKEIGDVHWPAFERGPTHQGVGGDRGRVCPLVVDELLDSAAGRDEMEDIPFTAEEISPLGSAEVRRV